MRLYISRRGRQIHLYVPNSLPLNNDPLLLPLTWRQNFQIYMAANKLHMSSSWICDCIISIYTIGSFIWNVIVTSSAIAECKWFTWNERKFNNSWLARCDSFSWNTTNGINRRLSEKIPSFWEDSVLYNQPLEASGIFNPLEWQFVIL